ncbi:MAG: tetratricopeptide repeat protein [Promethearchaeota archaeon]
MSYPELNQLTRAEQLFDEGELEKALEILNDWKQFEGLNAQQKSYYQFIKGLILAYQLKFEELIRLGEQIFEEGQSRNDNLQSFDGTFFIIFGLIEAEKIKEAQKLLEKAETSFKLISNEPKKVLNQRQARLNLLKAQINFELVNVDLAEQSLEWIFSQELPKSFEIVWAYSLKGRIEFYLKRNSEISLNYFKKALSIAKEIKFNHYWFLECHGFSGIIYHSIGDLDNCLKHYLKGLEKMKGFQSIYLDAAYLNNVGLVYCEKGEYDLALKTLKESLLFSEKKQSTGIAIPLNSLIEVALIKGDVELAKKYFHRLENLYNQKKEEPIELIYIISKALILKTSLRIRDKAKAEELFKQVIGTKTLYFDITISAYIHFCDLLLLEYQISNNDEVLDEINQNVTQLLVIAEKAHSYLVFCETFILQAKLALLTFNIKAARRFLTQAQKIAESYGIKRLAMKISNEHDILLKELHKWELLNESNASLAERFELARLDDQMTTMLKRRSIEVPEISKENPVMILILTEGGILLFSKKFKQDFSFDDDILGSFLTAVNYVISEVFSEGLDRAVFGQYTLLMVPLQPFLICYIFKGASYFAQHKIKAFVSSIQNDNTTWQSLQKFFQKSKSVQLNDIPSLESMIMEIFVEKNKL